MLWKEGFISKVRVRLDISHNDCLFFLVKGFVFSSNAGLFLALKGLLGSEIVGLVANKAKGELNWEKISIIFKAVLYKQYKNKIIFGILRV